MTTHRHWTEVAAGSTYEQAKALYALHRRRLFLAHEESRAWSNLAAEICFQNARMCVLLNYHTRIYRERAKEYATKLSRAKAAAAKRDNKQP